jgi:argininosuccinate lyase
MEKACRADQSNATDLADYLVKKGVPFRETHEISGKAVRLALARKIGLEDLALADLKALHPKFENDVFAQLEPRAVMSRRNSRGGTGVEAVRQQILYAEEQWKTVGVWKNQK